jgi:hypothetical protein
VGWGVIREMGKPPCIKATARVRMESCKAESRRDGEEVSMKRDEAQKCQIIVAIEASAEAMNRYWSR